MKAPDWTTTFAKYGAAFVLGAASLAGLAWSLNRQPAAVVTFAPQPQSKAVPTLTDVSQVRRAPSERAAGPGTGETRSGEGAAPAQPVESSAPPPAPPPEPTAPSAAHRVNLNTATQAELELLPGIGPALAQRILDFRAANGKFAVIDDLDKVKGIGARTLAKLRPLVTVD